ncbi:MAG TPA: outer membrane lipoprotein-sorting protein [Hyphomonas sp.]|jgi:hypothetical protein|uniref:outer membrane lipoprotein-sorting protein n=1 Tax=uncultured Hyphomonas sp. TaxID=225298 RepID=UPI000C65E8B4|nr:outer membrane lipoprotein-sorting protein [Hyphomonadaceae bacterium]HBL93793.1 outer membrane lipoprotein-sorting protein [Hyphomonas sp.]HCJ18787.1 outer membrane lipoprotein-sorting protein [Hyphomonas sp.]|tara:strand:- start:38211 stop:39017 length:807 start_codon:yes stop_codon:yes gene_type:complete
MKYAVTLSVLTALLVAGPADGQNTDAADIARQAERIATYQGDDGRARVAMEIIDKQGRTRMRNVTILRKDDLANNVETGDQRFFVYFHAPSDVRDTVFMVWKRQVSDDDRWLYLPALDLVRRIAAGDERSSFVGSDFYYEDVSGRSAEEDTHLLQDTTDTYFVLKSAPKDPSQVEFAYFVSYIHKESYLPVQIEYYQSDGTKYREYTAEAVETIQGYPTVTRATMKDVLDGGQTTLTYSQIEYDIGLSEDIFTERYLRNPPRQYLGED